ncbi:MAG: FkbM family methyltransferase [Candidatus Shapirobacteria bacterium]|nr:FkbM family methyltransferase [Candidatus Shapirobacteria bacterium]
MFETDYDLKKIQKIKTTRTNINMYITPRYTDHYINNEYEKYSINLIKNLIKQNQTFVDLGAHYGYYSLIINKLQKNNKIIAIEAVEENFKILKKNFNLNKINNCKLINAAASDCNGQKKFYISEASDSSGFINNPLAKNKKIIKIKTINIADLLKKKDVGLIKIDVEGHEVPVLKNIIKLNEFKNTNFIIEFNPKCQIASKHEPKEMLNLIKKANYDVFLIIDENKQKKASNITNESDISIYKITNDLNSWKKIINNKASVNIISTPINKFKLISFFSHSSQLAGAERSMLELIKELKDKNIFSHVVLPEEGPLQDELDKLTVPYDIVNLSWWTKNGLNNNGISLKNLINFIPKLSEINPSLIYSNTMASPWGAIAANCLNKPHIWHIREYGNLDHGMDFQLKFPELINFIEKNSNLIITNSKSVSRHISKYLQKEKPKVVYNYVEINKKLLKEKIKNPFLSKSSIKIIICGNIQPGKNQLEGVKLVNELVKQKINTELLILGGINHQKYFEEIKKYIKNNKIWKNIHIHDFVKNPYPYIKKSDIILIPSIKEAFGRTAVEGMILKKIVIANSNGGTKEIITNNKTGFVYKNGDIKSLVSIIKKVKNLKTKTQISESGFISLKKINTPKTYGYKIAKYIQSTIKEKNKSGIDPFLQKSLNELGNLEKFNGNYDYKIIEENKKLKTDLEKIQNSKTYKVWQKFNKIKKKILGKKKE